MAVLLGNTLRRSICGDFGGEGSCDCREVGSMVGVEKKSIAITFDIMFFVLDGWVVLRLNGLIIVNDKALLIGESSDMWGTSS